MNEAATGEMLVFCKKVSERGDFLCERVHANADDDPNQQS